eukprot:m51a1_g14822 hypothetical protein (74) ;mRNA; f:645635-645856
MSSAAQQPQDKEQRDKCSVCKELGEYSPHLCKHLKKYGLDEAYLDKLRNPTVVCAKCGRAAANAGLVCYPQSL